MQSSDGRHWIALDHVRAIAALMVFSWHFLHGAEGAPIPFGYAPTVFPLALLDEGHIGVALFMTLSGYLFAKLLDGKNVQYGRFFWNRFIRLAPLLLVVMSAYAVVQALQFSSFSFEKYGMELLGGLLFHTWPNGGWSITVEMHFYVLLPVILILTRAWPWMPALFIVAAIALRTVLFHHYGTVQDLAYYTIIGRFDQFLLGILAFRNREFIRGRHWLTGAAILTFVAFYWWFDRAGGFMPLPGRYPSSSPIWIWMPTLQGLVFALVIAYYDSSFKLAGTGVSRIIGRIGTYSYSIYLLHPFVVFRLPHFIGHRIMPLSNFYAACVASLVCFCGMAIIGWASFTFIEKPFLKLRVRYVRAEPMPSAGLATA